MQEAVADAVRGGAAVGAVFDEEELLAELGEHLKESGVEQCRVEEQLVRLRFELGLATTLDTLQAAVNVANLEPQLRRVRKQLLNDGARLNALLGRRPESALSIRNEQPLELDPIDM